MGNYAGPHRSTCNRRSYTLLLLVFLVGLAFRVVLLGSKSLWLDEANSLRVAQIGQELLWSGKSEGYHPPLFYLLVEWWACFRQDEFFLRLLAAIPGALSVLLTYFLAKEWGDDATGLLAASLVAFSPLLVWYSQELRPYALLSFLSLLTILALSRILRRPTLIWWSIFVLGMTAMLYMHYLSVTIIIVQFLLVMLYTTKWTSLGGWLAGLGLSFLAWIPWLRTPSAGRFLDLALSERNYLVSLIVARLGISWYPAYALILLFGVALLCILFGLSLRWLVRNAALQSRCRTLLKSGWICTLFMVTFLLFVIGSVVPRAYSIKRQLVMFAPFAFVLFSWWASRYRPSRIFWAMLLLASILGASVNVAVIPKPQWRELDAYLSAQYEQTDIVLIEPTYLTIPFDYYSQGRMQRQGLRFGAGVSDLEDAIGEATRVWLVVHGADRDAAQANRAYLDARFGFVEAVQFYKLELVLYEGRRVAE